MNNLSITPANNANFDLSNLDGLNGFKLINTEGGQFARSISDAGDDIYHFDIGWGQDVINNDDYNGNGFDTIRFGAGISPNDITVSRTSPNLYFTHSSGDQILLMHYFANIGDTIDQVEFADGTVWDQATIESLANGGNP